MKDQSNGKTLSGASIFLEGSSIATVTNEYEFYSLTAPEGNYTLIISYLGYKNLEEPVVLNKNIKFNSELLEDAGQLDQVIITAEESKKVDLRTPQMSVATKAKLVFTNDRHCSSLFTSQLKIF
ncbi:carboxypeptidase-like regulatory domain-containing protein [Aquimarina sp. 2201CG1-2-11]|uniref:carboxypeptidase-like regulatory domain-containing protein n=1 Tax=Aquimarina discodermiae TaxID=3231043 RepID=UPI003461EF38